MWLGEQITARGVGNGISLIIFAGIVANLPHALAATLELGRTGALSPVFILLFLVMSVVVVAFIVFMERAQRRILVQYPKRQSRQQHVRRRGLASAAEDQHLGRDPADLRLVAAAAAGDDRELSGAAARTSAGSARSRPIWRMAGRSTWCSMSALIVFFCFFYTAIVFNPAETADNLRKYGGFIPGIRPGKNTADYLDYVLTRLTVVGAAYLAAVCILPEILISQYSVPFYFGGTSLLIVVSVTMDTVAQIHSHLLAHQYEGLIKKAQAARDGADEHHPAGAAGRRQGHPGQAARGDARPGPARRPATCCAPRPHPGSALGRKRQGDHGFRRSWSPTTSSSR